MDVDYPTQTVNISYKKEQLSNRWMIIISIIAAISMIIVLWKLQSNRLTTKSSAAKIVDLEIENGTSDNAGISIKNKSMQLKPYSKSNLQFQEGSIININNEHKYIVKKGINNLYITPSGLASGSNALSLTQLNNSSIHNVLFSYSKSGKTIPYDIVKAGYSVRGPIFIRGQEWTATINGSRKLSSSYTIGTPIPRKLVFDGKTLEGF